MTDHSHTNGAELATPQRSRAASVLTRRDLAQLERASETVAARKQTTGFKVGEQGLYIESRQVKAMLKESTNVVFGGERFGPTRKTGKPFVAERVFIEPDRLWLGVEEPAGIEMTIGHVFGAVRSQGFRRFYVEQWQRID